MNNSHALRRNSAIALAVSSILAGGTQAARAQDTPAAALGEIVVTATRREQSIQDIPFNISAVSGESLESANLIDAVDALRTMPGISMQDRGYRNSGMGSSITIRGINVDSGTWGDVPLAAVPTVTTYVDDTALYGNFILKDIERVEVLRGPQGTLYGSGSLAGNVRYIMRKPDPSGFSGEARVAYGQTDGSDGYNLNPDVMLNIPVGETFAIRMNAGMIDNDGIIDYPHLYVLDADGKPVVTGGDANVLTATPEFTSRKDVDSVDIKYGRVSALFAPTDSFSAQLSYQRQEDEIDGRRQVTRGENLINGGEYGEYEFGAIQLEPSERDVELAALEMQVDLGFATLTSSTSYYEHTGTGISDNSGAYARNGWFPFYGGSPRPIAQAVRFYDDSAMTQEFRLVSTAGNKIDWTAGLYYTDQDSDLGQDSFLPGYIPYLNAYPWSAANGFYDCPPGLSGWYCSGPFTTEQDFLFRRSQKYEEMAVFGEMTVNFTEQLHLTLGGRYFDNDVEVDALVDIPIYPQPPGIATESISDSDMLFKANLAWDVTDDSMLYATFSQGYRHAGANAVPTTGKYGENPELLAFEADSIDNYEIGYKGTTGRMNFAVDVYYADWKDPQLNSSSSNWGFFAVINGQSARTQGFEVELSGSLTDSLSYSLGYTYADAELTDDVFQPAGNYFLTPGRPLYDDRVAADGDRLPGVAENTFNVSLRHDMAFSNGMELTTVLSGYYQSDVINSIGDDNCEIGFDPNWVAPSRCLDSPSPVGRFSGLPNPNYAPTSIYSRSYSEIDGFQIWHLSTTLSKDSWSASLFVKNLFNEEGTTGSFPFALGGSNTTGFHNYFGNNSRDFIALPRTIGVVLGYRF